MAEADPGIFAALARIPEVAIDGPEALDAQLRAANGPFVVRGLIADWPLVEAGRKSARDARDYILRRRRDRPFTVSVGEPGSDGRLFYDAAMAIDALGDEALPIYLASIDLHEYFDGLHEANHVDLGDRTCLASIWMGTRTRIAAHNDIPDNLACVAVGRRRFTLFPHEQFRNLYLGPIDNTPAGRAVSMVDFHDPDLAAHPRFADALAHAQVAELGAGDALYIPAMWWHHVEGLDPFNVLVNYWWRETPRWLGQPQDALNHAILAIRDLPDDARARWRDLFDYYVFEGGDDVTAHIPEEGRSILAPLNPETAGRIRAFLLRQLSQ